MRHITPVMMTNSPRAKIAVHEYFSPGKMETVRLSVRDSEDKFRISVMAMASQNSMYCMLRSVE